MTSLNTAAGEGYGSPATHTFQRTQHGYSSPSMSSGLIKSSQLYEEEEGRHSMERNRLEVKQSATMSQLDMLRTAHDDLQQSFDQSMQDITKLRETSAGTTRRLREQISDLTKQLTAGQAQRAELERQVQKATSDGLRASAEHQHELDRIKRARAQQDVLLKRRGDEIATQRDRLRDVEEAAANKERELEKTIVAHQGRARQTEDALTALKQTVAAADAKSAQLDKDHASQRKKLQQALDRATRQAEAKERDLTATVERLTAQVGSLQVEVADRSLAVGQTSAERDGLRDQLAAARAKAASDAARFEEEADQERASSTEQRHRLELQEQQMETIRADLGAAKREAEELRRSLAQQTGELQAALLASREEAATQRQLVDTTTATYEDEVTRVRTTLEQRDGIIAQLQDELRSARADHDHALQSIGRDHAAAIEDVRAELQTRATQLAETRDGLNRVQAERSDLEAQLDATRGELESVTRDAEQAREAGDAERAALRAELEEATSLGLELRDECSALRTTTVEQDRRLHDLTGQLEAAEGERDHKARAVFNLQNQLSATVGRHTDQLAELNDAHTMALDAEAARVADAQARADAAARTLNDTEERLVDVTAAREALQAAVGDLEGQLAATESDLDGMKQQAALNEEHWRKQVDAERADAKQHAGQLTEELDTAKARVVTQEAATHTAENRITELEQALQLEIDSAAEGEREADATIADLRARLAALTADHNRATEEAAHSNNRLTAELESVRAARIAAEAALDRERSINVECATDRTATVSALNGQVLELKEGLAQAEANADRLAKDAAAVRDRAERDRELAAAELTRVAQEKEFESQQAAAARLELETTRESHRGQLEEAMRATGRANEDRSAAENAIQAADARARAAEDEAHTLQDEVAAARRLHVSETERLSDDLTQARNELDRVIQERAAEHAREAEAVERLTLERDELAAAVRDLEADVAAARRTIQDMTAQHGDAQDSQREETASLKAALTAARDQVGQLSTQLAHKERRVAQLEDVQAEHTRLLEDRTRLLDEVAALRAEVESLQTRAEAAADDQHERESRASVAVQQLESDRATLQDKVRNLGRALDEKNVVATRSAVELETEKRRLTTQLSERDRTIEQLTRQLAVMQQSNGRYSAQLRQTQHLLTIRRDAPASPAPDAGRQHGAEMELAASRRLVSGLQARVATLEGRVGHWRAYVAKLRAFVDRQGLTRLAPPEPPVLREPASPAPLTGSARAPRSTLRDTPATPGM